MAQLAQLPTCSDSTSMLGTNGFRCELTTAGSPEPEIVFLPSLLTGDETMKTTKLSGMMEYLRDSDESCSDELWDRLVEAERMTTTNHVIGRNGYAYGGDLYYDARHIGGDLYIVGKHVVRVEHGELDSRVVITVCRASKSGISREMTRLENDFGFCNTHEDRAANESRWAALRGLI